ncbi:MAG: COX15/CtaA family protein [Pseudomonadota bacterium]
MTTATSDTSGRMTRPVLVWLICVAALVAMMVVVGGATRLTDSGLSITEWQPIMGAIPPLSDVDWQIAFDKYKQIPEYIQVNAGMSMAEFKVIFWWEWAHRFLGRVVGLVFFVPFVFFLVCGMIPRRALLPLIGLFCLGGFQGFLGWYMVQSGLSGRVDVSQYRLAAHLGLAIVIYCALIWYVLRERVPSFDPARNGTLSLHMLPRGFAISAVVIVGLVFLQILSGAFVAGMRAGLAHNTWPLMDGAFIPDGLFIMAPAWANLFENALTVQFNHRMLAYVLTAVVVVHVVTLLRQPSLGARRSGTVLGIAILGQMTLGIATLLAMVPVWLGVMHQGGSLVVLTAALVHADAVLRCVPQRQPALEGRPALA